MQTPTYIMVTHTHAQYPVCVCEQEWERKRRKGERDGRERREREALSFSQDCAGQKEATAGSEFPLNKIKIKINK